ncbi:MAG: DUF2975 domain-containing protein [Clostridia bacterium]|nr:DUF2975 domain-containing protein [Clostridia bacterium]
MKQKNKLSLYISLILSITVLAVILSLCFFLPRYIEWKCTNTLSMFTGDLPAFGEKVFIYCLSYLLMALAALEDGALIYLLLRIKKGLTFTDKTVKCIGTISLFIMVIGALFILLTPWFKMALAVGLLVVFVGVVIGVVKNVLEEATAIKNENDFTI